MSEDRNSLIAIAGYRPLWTSIQSLCQSEDEFECDKTATRPRQAGAPLGTVNGSRGASRP